jgi:hypothetical protein
MVAGTLLTYGGKRYLWAGVAGAIALLISYVYYAKDTIPSGSTIGGLIYGWIGLIAILILMFLGIRKRWYASHLGTLQGWTSAHVYLGLLLLLIIPMHAGFRFGWDVHTLAFALLAVVVLSGIVGLRLYLVMPRKLTVYESGMLPDKVEAEINRVLRDMKALAAGKSEAFARLYGNELRRCREIKSQGWRVLFRRVDPSASLAARTDELHRLVPRIPSAEQESFAQYCALALRKTELETFLAGQMRVKNMLDSWLYVHLPVSIAMVGAVAVHLLVVLYY